MKRRVFAWLLKTGLIAVTAALLIGCSTGGGAGSCIVSGKILLPHGLEWIANEDDGLVPVPTGTYDVYVIAATADQIAADEAGSLTDAPAYVRMNISYDSTVNQLVAYSLTIPAGDYAVIALLDVDGNGEVTMYANGPTEPVGLYPWSSSGPTTITIDGDLTADIEINSPHWSAPDTTN